MVQIKLIQSKDIEALNASVNEFLAFVDSEEVSNIEFYFKELVAVIQYEKKEQWKGRLCCDCKYWDDGGETSTSGLCHERGQRRRFNNPSCKCFKDVRG